MKLSQTADRAKTLRNIASGDKRFVRFSLSDCMASASRLQYFAENVVNIYTQEGEDKNETGRDS